MELLIWMLICLISTIIIECGFAILLKYRSFDLLIILLVNIMTNPLVVSTTHYFNLMYGEKGYYISFIILELFILVVEALVYKFFLDNKKINFFVLSFILNFLSLTFGLIINCFI